MFDTLTSPEQACIRNVLGDEAEALLARLIMTEGDTEEWEVSIFSCLVPETARVIFLSSLIADVEEDAELSNDHRSCLRELVADLDVAATIAATVPNADDVAAAAEVLSGVVSCMPDWFLSNLLIGTGVELGDLTEDEKNCLREWVTVIDWEAILTDSGDSGGLSEFSKALLSCTGGTPGVDAADSTDDHANSAEGATGATVGEAAHGALEYDGDIDYFVFDADKKALYQIGVVQEASAVDYVSLYVYDAEGRELASDYLSSLHPSVVWGAPTSGPHYVGVKGQTTGSYTLTIAVSDLVDDHTNSVEGATTTTVAEAAHGALEYEADIDFFAFEAEKGETYQIEVAVEPGLGLALTLHDADGQELASNNSLPPRVIWEAPSSGQHYVSVAGYFGTGDYTLTVAKAPAARSGTDAGSFVAVSAGRDHACGVKTDGAVVCWGSNEGWLFRVAGQAMPPTGTFASVSAGAYHTCGVRTDGFVECWGDDWLGPAAPLGFSFSSVSAGFQHTCGVTVDDSVECWGSNETPGGDFVGQATPPEGSFISVSAGMMHTCGVKTDGSVECWGRYWNALIQAAPPAPPEGSFISVSAGTFHTCGVRSDGSVECWGSDSNGESTPPDGTFKSVSAGENHTCGVRTDSSIACWGSNNYIGDFVGQATPPKGSFKSVSAGENYTCGVMTDGAAVCWGDDRKGRATPPVVAPVVETVADDHGNSGWEATSVIVGDTVDGKLDHQTDVDFFVFEAEEGKFYRIDVTLGTLPDSVATLYDTDVRWLASNDDYGDSNASRIVWKAPQTEKHHVRVNGAYSDDVGSYTLTIVAYEGADDYADTADGAASIAVDEAVKGALDYHEDADLFVFEAEGGKLYLIDVALETLSDSVATLYDVDEQELASNDDQGDSLASRIHWKAPNSGRYYVVVDGYDIGSYTLTVVSGIADDHGDSREESTSVTVGRVFQGVLQFEGDEDHFSFQAEEGKSYWVDVYLDTLPDANVIVTDEEGGLEAFHSGAGGFSGEIEISVSADSSGRYYISVAGQTGSYTVAISDASLGRAALVALYNATDGPNWEDNTNWLSNEPLDEWYGVTTDFINERVTYLDLQENKLSGEIPHELGSLFSLKGLYLNQNALTGEIPIELAKLSKLTELALWGNQLSGEIPLELGNLPNLVGLALGWNQLTGEVPRELGNLAKLTALGLQGNQLTGEVPADLSNLSNLRELSLSGNRLTGCVPASLEAQLSLSDLGDLSFC